MAFFVGKLGARGDVQGRTSSTAFSFDLNAMRVQSTWYVAADQRRGGAIRCLC